MNFSLRRRPKIKWHFTQGSFVVNTITLRSWHRKYIAFEMDCRSKYPYLTWGHNDKAFHFYIGPDENSLHIDENAEHKYSYFEISNIGDANDWLCSVDTGRYTVYIVLYKWDNLNWFNIAKRALFDREDEISETKIKNNS